MLLPVGAPAPLTGWALRVAAERGDPAELARATAPGDDADLATQAAWLEVRHALEQHDETPAIAEALAARAREAGRTSGRAAPC